MLQDFFTRGPSINLPQNIEQFYRFKLGEKVRLNLSKADRRSLSYKFSLYPGNCQNKIELKSMHCFLYYPSSMSDDYWFSRVCV